MTTQTAQTTSMGITSMTAQIAQQHVQFEIQRQLEHDKSTDTEMAQAITTAYFTCSGLITNANMIA